MKVVFLDFDDNLVAILRDRNSRHQLSASAEANLSDTMMDVNMVVDEVGPISCHSVSAIARNNFLEWIFRPYFEICREASQQDLAAPVRLVILTSANYTANEVREVLHQLYRDVSPDYEKHFATGGAMEIEVINKQSFRRTIDVLVDELPPLNERLDKMTKLPNRYFDARTKQIMYDPTKTLVMMRYQEQLAEAGIMIDRRNMYLMDNYQHLLAPAADAGFSVILNGSTPAYNGGKKFSEMLPVIKLEFENIMHAAREELDAAIQQKTQEREKLAH